MTAVAHDSTPPAHYTPKGYIVFDLDVTDAETYERYRKLGQAAVRRFGGRVLSGEPAPVGIVEPLEGEWNTKRLVIIEFESVQAARDWYNSAEYQRAAAMRQGSTRSRGVLVGGWREPW